MIKHSTLAFLFVAVLAQQAQAAAAVYKCVKHREVTYQSEPCPTPIRRTEPNIKKLNEERMKKLLETGTNAKSGKSANDGQFSAKAGDASVAPTPTNTPVSRTAAPLVSAPSFKCDGRTRCNQMTSCEEATYFLNNCPGVKMDGRNGGPGSGNGIPCERQWCNRE